MRGVRAVEEGRREKGAALKGRGWREKVGLAPMHFHIIVCRIGRERGGVREGEREREGVCGVCWRSPPRGVAIAG